MIKRMRGLYRKVFPLSFLLLGMVESKKNFTFAKWFNANKLLLKKELS